jgi:hypothetical protein
MVFLHSKNNPSPTLKIATTICSGGFETRPYVVRTRFLMVPQAAWVSTLKIAP